MNELLNQRIGVLKNVTLEQSSLANTHDSYIVSRFILIRSSHQFTVSYIQCLSEGKFQFDMLRFEVELKSAKYMCSHAYKLRKCVIIVNKWIAVFEQSISIFLLR